VHDEIDKELIGVGVRSMKWTPGNDCGNTKGEHH
jgi:hypothetical protein